MGGRGFAVIRAEVLRLPLYSEPPGELRPREVDGRGGKSASFACTSSSGDDPDDEPTAVSSSDVRSPKDVRGRGIASLWRASDRLASDACASLLRLVEELSPPTVADLLSPEGPGPGFEDDVFDGGNFGIGGSFPRKDDLGGGLPGVSKKLIGEFEGFTGEEAVSRFLAIGFADVEGGAAGRTATGILEGPGLDVETAFVGDGGRERASSAGSERGRLSGAAGASSSR